jgi:hypothetical protein
MLSSKSNPRRHSGRQTVLVAGAAPAVALLTDSRSRLALSAVFCAAVMAACGGSPGGSSGANNAPIANAGASQNAAAGTVVTLNGSNSTDPDGDPLTYSWVIAARPSTSAAILNNATSVSPTFTPDAPGDYTVSLVVRDNRSANSNTSNVVVTVTGGNSRPVANAGPDQSVVVGQTVTLDGVQSTDANRDSLTYSWSVRKPDNVTVIVPASPNSALASFVPDVAGVYVATLVVNDGSQPSDPDTTSITVGATNVAPSAIAGPHTPDNRGRARYVLLNNLPVVLDGSPSRDANGDSFTYGWSLFERPTLSASVMNANTVNPAVPNFVPDVVGTYRPRLVTNDGRLSSAEAFAAVVVGAGNVQPNASAGTFYQTVVSGSTVTLDGRRSFDSNAADIVQYSWSLVSKPTGSTAVLSSPVSAQPTFVADRAGVYVASLIVNDGQLSSIADATAVVALAQAGPYDGTWSGTTNQGRAVSFGISASQINSIQFTWLPGGCGASSVDTIYTFVPPKPMDSGSFTITEATGDVRAISATFTTQRTATGSFNLQFLGANNCVVNVPVTFTATR